MLERSPFVDFVENFRREYGIDLILDEDVQNYVEQYAQQKNLQVSETLKKLLFGASALNYMGIKGTYNVTKEMVQDETYFDRLFANWYEKQKGKESLNRRVVE